MDRRRGPLGRLVEQFLRFGVVGTVAFVIDFGLMVALTELLGINPIVSAACSFVVSLIFNYLASMRFVFKHRDDLSREREMAIFVALSLVGLAINEAIMWVGVDVVKTSYLLVKVLATGIVMLWNFFSRKRWLDASR